jgi:hypothetical protein
LAFYDLDDIAQGRKSSALDLAQHVRIFNGVAKQNGAEPTPFLSRDLGFSRAA